MNPLNVFFLLKEFVPYINVMPVLTLIDSDFISFLPKLGYLPKIFSMSHSIYSVKISFSVSEFMMGTLNILGVYIVLDPTVVLIKIGAQYSSSELKIAVIVPF